MADYAGAVAAIIARMAASWTTTPVVYQNANNEYDPGQHTDDPWVYFEVIGSSSGIRGFGTPGSQTWLYRGFISAHVFVPINTGTVLAQQYAASIGEIFRAQGFYNDGAGAIVRCGSPRTDGGDSSADNGNWWRVTSTTPFEYLHRG